ncbi:MAG: pyruvate, water dikinase regulatory protein [Deferribacterales bacterium]
MSDRIYIVSDGTGQSAVNIMRAALLQFNEPHTKLTVYSMVNEKAQLMSILEHARLDESVVAYTMVSGELRQIIHEYCEENNLSHVDILGPPLRMLADYLGKEPQETPGVLRKVDEKYFKRIEAMEFTLTHDDGKSLKGITEADLVILGLSRTSKTPTSFYLAQQGFKVINVPLVPEIPINEDIFKIDQHKVVILMMDPEVLQKIRSARLKHYKTSSNYNNINKIFEEVEFCYDLVRKNRKWNMINTTNKSIEETAREIIHSVYGRDMEL